MDEVRKWFFKYMELSAASNAGYYDRTASENVRLGIYFSKFSKAVEAIGGNLAKLSFQLTEEWMAGQ